MADYSILSALRRDTLCVQSLPRQLGYPLSTMEVEDQIELYTSSDARGLLVADSVGTAQPAVIGLVAFSKTPIFVKKAWRVHIEALVVDALFRHQGLGRRLLEYVQNVTASLGKRVVDLTSGQHRAASGAHAFYRTLGFANEGSSEKIYLRKEL